MSFVMTPSINFGTSLPLAADEPYLSTTYVRSPINYMVRYKSLEASPNMVKALYVLGFLTLDGNFNVSNLVNFVYPAVIKLLT